MMLVDLVNKKLAIETVIAQLFVVWAIVHLLFLQKRFPAVNRFFGKYGILLAGIVALVATASSLFYSEVAGFPPCELCWYQRIFMYPLVILLGAAIWKRDSNVTAYALPLAIVGGLVSLYHNYIYYFNTGLAKCLFSASGVSCVKRYVFEFGYITIPLMALTAFLAIIVLLVFSKYGKNT